MGSSDGGAGSGGAWSGAQHGVADFADAPTEDSADALVDQALQALNKDTEQQDDDGQPPDTLPQIAPQASPLPGLRVRRGSGGGGVGASGAGGGGGGQRRRTGGGGGRSSKQAARAASQALGAGYALQRGDQGALDTLGLSLADLQGLGVNEQINHILNITIPATGSPLEQEMRMAAAGALIKLLKDGEEDPSRVVQEFVIEFVFETLVAEYGPKFRDGSHPDATLRDGERLLRDSICSYAEQVEIPEGPITTQALQGGIETVTNKTTELARQ